MKSEFSFLRNVQAYNVSYPPC